MRHTELTTRLEVAIAMLEPIIGDSMADVHRQDRATLNNALKQIRDVHEYVKRTGVTHGKG